MYLPLFHPACPHVPSLFPAFHEILVIRGFLWGDACAAQIYGSDDRTQKLHLLRVETAKQLLTLPPLVHSSSLGYLLPWALAFTSTNS